MSRPAEPVSDHEYERLNPGASKDPPQPNPVDRKPAPRKNDAALPGSPNADLRDARRDRRPRGMST
jgi:hypothetical protein